MKTITSVEALKKWFGLNGLLLWLSETLLTEFRDVLNLKPRATFKGGHGCHGSLIHFVLHCNTLNLVIIFKHAYIPTNMGLLLDKEPKPFLGETARTTINLGTYYTYMYAVAPNSTEISITFWDQCLFVLGWINDTHTHSLQILYNLIFYYITFFIL